MLTTPALSPLPKLPKTLRTLVRAAVAGYAFIMAFDAVSETARESGGSLGTWWVAALVALGSLVLWTGWMSILFLWAAAVQQDVAEDAKVATLKKPTDGGSG